MSSAADIDWSRSWLRNQDAYERDRQDVLAETEAKAEMLAAFQRAVAPPPRLSVEQWAERYRVLTRHASAVAGPWRNSMVPYASEIMKCLSDRDTRHVVFMKSSQIAGTEIGLNMVGQRIMCDPGPILWATSTDNAVKKLSRVRLDPMLEARCFQGLVSEKKSRDSDRTTNRVGFQLGGLNLVSSNSPSSMASDPIRDAVCDEVDRYRLSSQDEGDAIALILARQTSFEEFGAKTYYVSSPDIDEISRIQQLYQESDQRRFLVPCHACGRHQELVWEQVRWEKDKPETAQYECSYCKGVWSDARRWESVSRGLWEANAPFHGTAGFFAWAAYSRWVRLKTIAERWKKAQGKPEQLQGFLNTVLGQCWSADEGSAPEDVPREVWQSDFPVTGCLLLAFADVQGDRIEVSVAAMASDETLFPIHHEILMGQPAQNEVWKRLAEFRERKWRRDDGRLMGVHAMGVDCGFLADRVTEWTNAQRALTFAVRGQGSGITEPVVSTQRASKNRAGHKFWNVNPDASKLTVVKKLNLESGPGRIRYPARACFDDGYFKQIRAEKLVPRYVRGFRVLQWAKKAGSRNEALDCLAGIWSVFKLLNPALEALAVRAPALEPAPEQPVVLAEPGSPAPDAPAVDRPRLPPEQRRKRKITINRGGRSWSY